MNAKSLRAWAGTAVAFCLAAGLSVISPVMATSEPNENEQVVAAQPDDGGMPATVAEARARAKLMHNIYAATLDAIHHHYFRRDRPVLPARAMEDVFDEIERQSNIKAGWISVNTKAMSFNHEPRDDFERQAATAIAAGKHEFESVANGLYRRAGAIPLGASCVGCHTGFFSKAPQTKRFAGLVISVPINPK